MTIEIIGINHRSAPINIREKLSFGGASLPKALDALKAELKVKEGVIISTCNRIEIYAAAKQPRNFRKEITDFLGNFHNLTPDFYQGHIYQHSGIEAVKHLFRVSSSLDSQVLGENQILGQVKDAYFKARDAGAVSRIFSFVFDEAIKMGKRARTDTQIGCGAVSVSTAAVELVKKIFNDFSGKKILIIGAGKIGELAVRHLYDKGAEMVLVANRTFEKAQKLAQEFNGQAISFDKFSEALEVADIVISSVSAPHLLLTKAQVENIMTSRKQRPIFFIDLGLPRNIDPLINSIDNVYVYNIDDLNKVKDANLKERMREAEKIEQMIEERLLKIDPKLKELLRDQNE